MVKLENFATLEIWMENVHDAMNFIPFTFTFEPILMTMLFACFRSTVLTSLYLDAINAAIQGKGGCAAHPRRGRSARACEYDSSSPLTLHGFFDLKEPTCTLIISDRSMYDT